MIRTDAEYREAVQRLEQDRAYLEQHRADLTAIDIVGDDLERAMAPARSFYEQLRERVATYERMRRGDFEPIYNLTSIGRMLIGLRIAYGLSQRELAERLDVSESVVSRDERNDYYGISVAKAQRILDAFQARIRLELEEPVGLDRLVGAEAQVA